MSQLKRYNGTNWENVGGSVAPKTSQTTSDTDTYSCNYVNNNLTNIKSAIDYKNPDYMGDVVVESIRSKNMFDSSTIVQGDITNAYPTLRMTSRQVLWLEAGTYTFSTNLGSSYQFGIQVQNVGTLPLSTWPSTFIYSTDWLTTGTTTHTFTTTTAGWFNIMLRRSDNGAFTSTDITNLKGYNYQLETGSTATTYAPYQNLNGYDNYSTGEIRIGTWINGKPLYRKVISTTLPDTSATKDVLIDNDMQLGFMEVAYFNSPASNYNRYFTFPFLSNDGKRVIAWVLTQNNSVHIVNEISSYSNMNCYISILYTKTTD